jgi:hypothetical protein
MTSQANWIAFGSLLLALSLVGIRTLTMLKRTGFDLRRRMGPANWNYSTSWASTFTLVGALLGTILAQSGVVPEPTHYLPRAAYAGLNVVFAMVTVLAPFLYTALSRVEHPHSRTGLRRPQYQGFVWSFLLATALTLWAVLGELITVSVLLSEIGAGGALPFATVVLFALLLVLGVVLLCVYAWRGINWIVTYQADRPSHANELQARARVIGVKLAEETKGKFEAPLPSWSVM